MKRLLLPLAALAIAGLLFTSVQRAYACSCVEPDLQAEIASADLILVGTVSELLTVPPLDPVTPDDLEHKAAVVVQVDEHLKGTGPSQVTVAEPGLSYTFSDDGQVVTSFNTCSLFGEDSPAKRYVLMLNGDPDALTSPGLCSGSRIADETYLQQVLDITGPGTLPQDAPAPGEQADGGFPWLTVAIAAIAGTGALGTAAWLIRRRARHSA